MFFGEGKIDADARDDPGRRPRSERERALAKLLPLQRADFDGIFRAMDGLPVTIRILDPPLHEFLPHDRGRRRELAAKIGIPARTRCAQRVEELHEFNPMLGFRGCRLGIVYPGDHRDAGARRSSRRRADVQATASRSSPRS